MYIIRNHKKLYKFCKIIRYTRYKIYTDKKYLLIVYFFRIMFLALNKSKHRKKLMKKIHELSKILIAKLVKIAYAKHNKKTKASMF